MPNKIEKSIELWCCVVPNEANYLAEGPGSVRVRDESSVEIQAGQETLPFEFDLVTQLTRDISGHNDPSFRKWQVIVNQQLRRGPGRATIRQARRQLRIPDLGWQRLVGHKIHDDDEPRRR